jgi:hypothetical protein
MNEFYYTVDGVNSIGPHTADEMASMLKEKQLPLECPVYKVGDTEWKLASSFPELTESKQEDQEEEEAPVSKPSPKFSEEDKEGDREEEQEIKERKPTRHQLLRKIRKDLDSLWEAQRESIIARVKDEDLDTEFEATRKKHKDMYAEIEEAAVEYWRRTGILKEWIADLTWNDCDLTLRLKNGSSEEEKFNQVMTWLESKEISTLPGVYCFRNGKEYIYVGMGRSLATRIKQHEQKTFFTYATHFRVVVPQNKKHLRKLERLIILNRQPSENSSPGYTKGNPADDCLEFIKGEIRELITDF